MTVEDKSPVSRIFSLGISKSLQRIKFGGVVGKQALLGVTGAGMLTAIALKVGGQPALVLGGLAGGLLILIAILNYRFADKHTAEATLEGLEMIAYQHRNLVLPNQKRCLKIPPSYRIQAGPYRNSIRQMSLNNEAEEVCSRRV